MQKLSHGTALKMPTIRIDNPGDCCLKWSQAIAVPLSDPDESLPSAYARHDLVNFCPVCGKRFAKAFEL